MHHSNMITQALISLSNQSANASEFAEKKPMKIRHSNLSVHELNCIKGFIISNQNIKNINQLNADFQALHTEIVGNI